MCNSDAKEGAELVLFFVGVALFWDTFVGFCFLYFLNVSVVLQPLILSDCIMFFDCMDGCNSLDSSFSFYAAKKRNKKSSRNGCEVAKLPTTFASVVRSLKTPNSLHSNKVIFLTVTLFLHSTL